MYSQTSHDYQIRDQVAGVIVDRLNTQRIQAEVNHLFAQDQAFLKATEQIDKIRQFVGNPSTIIGRADTKHGEIAEQVEVGIRNARQALSRQNMTATFDGIGRTAPQDYMIDGVFVQSKFINGVSNNLDHVIHHMETYPDFGRDGSYYHIPKDTHEILNKILNKEHVEGLSEKSVNTIRTKIAAIEAESEQPFNKVVKPGVSDYSEVQQGKINQTINRHENDLAEKNRELKDSISENHSPSFAGALKSGGIAAAVGGAVSLTAGIYKKHKEGKNLFKGAFSQDDWKELGISTVKGAIGGGVAGAAIYGLTNYAALSAPFAGAVVSAAKGVGSLVSDYQTGKISFDKFIELGMIVCGESAIVGICTAAGQTLIPIPVLGAVIGSVAGQMLAQFVSGKISGVEKRLQDDMTMFLSKIESVYAEVVAKITTEFERLGKLTEIAFDFGRNMMLLEISVELARAYGVEENKIIKKHNELDVFMMA